MSILPLTIEGAVVRHRGTRIVGPVDLSLAAGGPTIILGPNGAGKTTLLKAMHGIERLSAGRAGWSVPRAEADLAQTYVFQTPILLRRTAIENVIYPLRLRGVPRREARDIAGERLSRVGLAEAGPRPAHALSGGERQKLAIARALVSDPEVLFLDEPTASLDGRSTREIEAILSGAVGRGVKLVMATHDLGQARRLASEILFIYGGDLHEHQPAEAFFAGPKTPEARAFLKGDIVE